MRPLATVAQTGREWQDPAVNEVNRLPMRASFEAGERMSLDGVWRFHWVRNASERPSGIERADYDDASWGRMPVPGMWELNGYGDPIYVNIGYAWRGNFVNNPPEVPDAENHVGSYRRTFTLPESWAGKDVSLNIGSATSNVYVWLNGRFVGYSEDSKLSADFDVTKYLRKGENLLALQVSAGATAPTSRTRTSGASRALRAASSCVPARRRASRTSSSRRSSTTTTRTPRCGWRWRPPPRCAAWS